jgi:hypothetical protein
MLQNIKEAKSLAKGLRREVLSHSSVSLMAMTHTQWMALLAKAAGYPSWNAMRSRLLAMEGAADTPPVPSDSVKSAGRLSYLSNDKGAFDFGTVAEGEQCNVLDGMSFQRVVAVWETIPGTAAVQGAYREQSLLAPVYAGGTEVDWDGQRPQKSQRGQDLYVREDGVLTESSLLVLLPEEYSVHDQEHWPVRQALVQAYKDWLEHNASGPEHKAQWLSQAYTELGLKLTAAEEDQVLSFF